jgi:hypothetical protein
MSRLCTCLVLVGGIIGLAAGQLHRLIAASPGTTQGKSNRDDEPRGLIARVRELEDKLKALQDRQSSQAEQLGERIRVATGELDGKVTRLDGRVDTLSGDLKNSKINVAVRDYFLIADPAQHLKDTGYGTWLKGPQIFLPQNQRTEQVVPERFGREVLAAALIPVTLDTAELQAYEVVKADVAPPNQIKIWGERKGSPWGLWVRAYIFYKD